MTIAVLLPVFNPDPRILSQQLESLVNQSVNDLSCVISHDGPIESTDQELLTDLVRDERFQIQILNRRLGTFRHVEYLIAQFGLQSEYFALCDQDDVWNSNKLERQMELMRDPGVVAVSANASIVDRGLKSIRGLTTFEWFGISPQNVRYRMALNQFTGASLLCRSEPLRNCVPFPKNHGTAVHDHWIYVSAVSAGETRFIDEPLWLYRQHGSNQIGAAAQGPSFMRVIRGLSKAFGILMNRLSGKEDAVMAQAREFLGESMRRWPGSETRGDLVMPPLEFWSALKLLSLKELVGSRLESLRLFLYRKDGASA